LICKFESVLNPWF